MLRLGGSNGIGLPFRRAAAFRYKQAAHEPPRQGRSLKAGLSRVPGAMLIIPDRGILCAAHAPRMRACDS
jgi:hypothetical protein